MELSSTSRTITAEAARGLIEAAARKATEEGKAMVIAVVGADGNLKAFERMDGAPLLSVDIAINKAWTAVAFGLPTHGFGEFVASDEGIEQIRHTPRLVTFGGGYPLTDGDALIGGIGVSGGHYSEDMAIAEAALQGVGFSA
jgi:uncharacterized protein GlcG (DUF336 family)